MANRKELLTTTAKEKKEYYDCSKIIAEGSVYNIVIGQRSNGKKLWKEMHGDDFVEQIVVPINENKGDIK